MLYGDSRARSLFGGGEMAGESDGVPTLCESFSESDEDRTALQFREHFGNIRTEAVIAETTPAPIDPPLDGGHKMEGAGIGIFLVCA